MHTEGTNTDDACELLETLSEIAESDTNYAAADSLLQELIAGPIDVVATTKDLLELRKTIVRRMAEEYSKRHPRWTMPAWFNYIDNNTFDRDMMNAAIDIWRDEIYLREMEPKTWARELRAPNANQRRSIRRSAFRAWQRQKYGHATLAKTFLKFPKANLASLLEDWEGYTKSMDYQRQKPKHAPVRQQQLTTPPPPSQGGDGCAATACTPPVSELPTGRGTNHYKRLRVLRYQRNLAFEGRADKLTMEWCNSGGLDRELEQMTKEHGTGRWWDQKGMPHDLYPHSFPQYLQDNT